MHTSNMSIHAILLAIFKMMPQSIPPVPYCHSRQESTRKSLEDEPMGYERLGDRKKGREVAV